MKLLEIIQTVPPDKARVIDQVMELHPAYGIEKGWSWYVGGMRDSGEWQLDKLIQADWKELEEFLEYHITKDKETDRKHQEWREKWSKMTTEERRQWQIDNWNKEQEALKNIREQMEMRIMWGKPNN